MKEEIKCYCGHTTTCDCGPEEPKQEISYSEEDMKSAFLDGWELRDGDLPFPKAKNKWFEQFKKK